MALSTSEAEYVTLSSATQEVVWLRKLLMTDLRVTSQGPTVLMEDNQGAIAISKNPVGHARTKHIDIRYIITFVKPCKMELSTCTTVQQKR